METKEENLCFASLRGFSVKGKLTEMTFKCNVPEGKDKSLLDMERLQKHLQDELLTSIDSYIKDADRERVGIFTDFNYNDYLKSPQ